jgi:hypothetical protein
MLRKIIGQVQANSYSQTRLEQYRNLIRREAVLGGAIFGKVASGHRREFFCLDEHTWVWHEEWTDYSGARQVRNTRYDVRPNGVVKIQDGKGYQSLSPTEIRNLKSAIQIYYNKVVTSLYHQAI